MILELGQCSLVGLVLSSAAIAGFVDCNDNGIPDDLDILNGTSIDCDGDGVPDECQASLDCDGNGYLDTCEADAIGGLVGQYWRSDDGAGASDALQSLPAAAK